MHALGRLSDTKKPLGECSVAFDVFEAYATLSKFWRGHHVLLACKPRLGLHETWSSGGVEPHPRGADRKPKLAIVPRSSAMIGQFDA